MHVSVHFNGWGDYPNQQGYTTSKKLHAYFEGAFVRYENFDTQFKMPAGVLPLKQFDRAAWVFGGSYFPDPDVVFKIDYTIIRNRSTLFHSVDGFNVGLGWWF